MVMRVMRSERQKLKPADCAAAATDSQCPVQLISPSQTASVLKELVSGWSVGKEDVVDRGEEDDGEDGDIK